MHEDTALLEFEELQDLYNNVELKTLLTQVQKHLNVDTAIIVSEVNSGSYVACRASTHRLKSMLMFLTGDRLRPDFEMLEQALLRDAASVPIALTKLLGRLDTFEAELAGALNKLH